MLIGRFNAFKLIIIVPFLILFDLYFNWNDKKVFNKYHYIEQNRKLLRLEFKQVYWFILIDILFYIATLLYITFNRPQ